MALLTVRIRVRVRARVRVLTCALAGPTDGITQLEIAVTSVQSYREAGQVQQVAPIQTPLYGLSRHLRKQPRAGLP